MKLLTLSFAVEPIEVHCRLYDPFADKVKEIMAKVETMLKESESEYWSVALFISLKSVTPELLQTFANFSVRSLQTESLSV